jgi:hypothetical protein
MSVDRAFREMIRNEIEVLIRPLQSAVARLQEGSAELYALRDLATRLAPLTALLGGRPAGRRGPGRPPGSGRRGRRSRVPGQNDRVCALIGCRKKARSKGYCAAHYQKFRMLTRTHRRPADWAEYAPPNSVKDIVLPRGRAAAKAKARSSK